MVSSTDIPIIGDSNQVPQDDPEYTLNMYAEKVTNDILTLKPTPGSVFNSQYSINGGGRGEIVVEGRRFGVRGSFFQEMVGTTGIVKGELLSDANKVAMISCVVPPTSGLHAQILIVDDLHGYVYDLVDNTFTLLTTLGNFNGGGSQAAFCAGRAYVFVPGTTVFQCSNQYDFKTWNSTANATALSLSTALNAIGANGDLLYLFSNTGFEIWQDDGSVPLGVARILAGDKTGCMAPNSLVAIQRFFYWLGGNDEGRGVIYRHSGGGLPQRVSNHSTERQIAQLATPTDAQALTYQSLGHIFYLLTFRAGNKTICYDEITGLWHDRAVRDASTGTLSALPWISTCIFNGDILAIDYRDGKVFKIDDQVFTDDGAPILRDRILSVAPKEGDYLTFFQSVELFGQIK
jgi:hypothetical protein